MEPINYADISQEHKYLTLLATLFDHFHFSCFDQFPILDDLADRLP